ncbi:MAG TPA: DUF2852 domain-containing protein [Xanthobacteraceae bacterium]|nr:DUF2852 domain-containing protein [Xanthobacteraceae bacterium]
MSCDTMAWRNSAARQRGGLAQGWARKAWTPWEIALMVTGFVVFWPAGLAILFWILWTRRHGTPAWFDRIAGVISVPGGPRMRGASGNSAFDEWKRSELDRLEQERRRLAEAEQDFAAFLDQLKRARDREEFDRFMAARKAPPLAQ